MKKASKVLVLLLIVVFVLGVFAGCGMIGKNTEKYRATTAITVGNEKITIGKLIDNFNNYYSNYLEYIRQGQISVNDVFAMSVQALYSQYMKIDEYKASNQPVSATGDFANQEYLTAEELDYTIKYVKYVLYTTLDSVVEGYIKADFELKDEEKEDTSRDFREFDDLKDNESYSDYVYSQNLSNEDMDEYISKYYEGVLNTDNLSVDAYVYATAEQAAQKLDDLNKRLEDDEEITFAQYKEWQEQALKQYKKNVLRTYEYDINALIKRQVEDLIVSVIVAKYNYNVYKAIDHEELSKTLSALKETYNSLKDNQEARFNVDNDFVKHIDALTDTSYIFTVLENYNYIFVKNILIPFTDAQKTILSNLQSKLGSSKDPRYIAKRTELASQIVADDFLSEKDDDGKYQKVENIFALKDGKLVVNPDGALGAYFKADGKLSVMDGKTADETVVELMKQYNTDTAQHSALYEYVVRVGEVPESYNVKWVPEFVEASNEAYDLATAAGANGGYYGLAISSYGVHIVYYSSRVTAQSFNFDNDNYLKTNLPEYRMFKTYYNSQSSELLSEAVEALQKAYYPSKIVANSNELKKFLKQNGLTFDFEKSLKLDEE